jgi:ABC-type anion transport system duplicated permease subunit
MKIFAIAFGVLAILAGIMIYNLWLAENEPITNTPGQLEQTSMQLHNQLVQAEQREVQFEKLYWDSPGQLRVLITSHRRRIEELAGNKQAGEIVAHDRDAVARLEKRIADLDAQRLAGAEQAQEAEEARKAKDPAP